MTTQRDQWSGRVKAGGQGSRISASHIAGGLGDIKVGGIRVQRPYDVSEHRQEVTARKKKHPFLRPLLAKARQISKRQLKPEQAIAVSHIAHVPLLRAAREKITGLSKRKAIILASGCLAIVIVLGGLFAHSRPRQGHNANPNTSTQQQITLVKGTPDYPTLLPAGKSIDSLGGWTRVSPPGRDPVYAYVDKIQGVLVDVSEQPLPKSFQSGTAEAVAQLAQGFNADQKLVIDGTTIYIGTSAKGPQSVIFTKNNLLILIKSESIITNNQWAAYVSSMQ